MQSTVIMLWKIFLLLGSIMNASTQLLAPQDIRFYQPLKAQDRANPTTQLPPPQQSPFLAPMTSSNPFYKFNAKLFRLISPAASQTNLIYSPSSLQTILAFISMGAVNQTAYELRNALELSQLPGAVARQFQDLLHQMQRQSTSTMDLQIQMANKMYYTIGLQLNDAFYKRVKHYFNAETESIDFRVPEVAAHKINTWTADHTNQRILDLIPAGSLDSNIKAILVNAIYLKAKWEREFSVRDTERSDFKMFKDRTVPVDMMFTEDQYDYAEFKDLNLKAISMPFADSDLSMLILLPNEVDGLGKLEAEFPKVELASLIAALRTETVLLRLPKFRIDFDLDMTATLKKLGITRLFSEQAQLDDFFKNQTALVSKVQHKAYINVNEGGVEAAAATFGKLVPLSAPARIIEFYADHPFMFLIYSPQAVYFIGHVINP